MAFQPRFTELDQYQLTQYLILVVIAGVAAVLALAPVTLHRIHFGRGRKARIVRMGGRMLAAGLVVVALLAVGVTSLIFDFTVSRAAGHIALSGGLVTILLLWTLLPLVRVSEPHDVPAEEASGAEKR